jgi:hypothetical protein
MRIHAMVAAAALALGVVTTSEAVQEVSRPARPVRAQTQAPAPQPPIVSDRPAYETRDQLQRILQQYPPMLRQVLRLDPTLLANEGYLGMYPTLAAFLAQHSEVAHNPGFFLGGYGDFEQQEYTDRSRAIAVVENVLIGALVLIGFCFVTGLAAWGLKTFVEHRRWLRVSKFQVDAHSKLLDRLTSSEDLLAYIQSSAGRQFLEGAMPPAEPKPQTVSPPINRMLWSVQVGIVLVLTGAGLWYSRWFTIQEVAQPLSVLGVLAMFVGAGFVISAFVSYALSRALGLFEPPALHPNA